MHLYEVTNGSKFLGKPFEPNAIIKNDMEFILMQRKPGGYRKPSNAQRDASRISKDEFNSWSNRYGTSQESQRGTIPPHSLWN